MRAKVAKRLRKQAMIMCDTNNVSGRLLYKADNRKYRNYTTVINSPYCPRAVYLKLKRSYHA